MRLATNRMVEFSVLVLTGFFFMYPINSRVPADSAIQALAAFPNLPLFLGLFLVWGICLGFTTANAMRHASRLELLFSISCLSLVFLATWVRFTMGSTHGQYSISQANFILGNGFLPFDVGNFIYRGYPSLDLLIAEFSSLLHISLFLTGTVLTIVFTLVFAWFTFLYLENILRNRTYAWIGAALIVIGNQTLTVSMILMWGGVLGFPSLAILLFLLAKGIKTTPARVAMLSVFAMLSLAYFPTPTLFLGIGLLTLLWYRDGASIFLGILVTFLVINLFVSISMSTTLISLFYTQGVSLLNNPLVTILSTLSNPVRVAATGLLRVPLWAQATQIAWVILLLPASLLVFFPRFVHVLIGKDKKRYDRILVSGTIVSVAGAVVGGLAISNGSQFVYRLIEYVPFFAVPGMLLVVSNFSRVSRRRVTSVLFLFILLLAIPTFFVDHKSLSIQMNSPSDDIGFSFVAASFPGGKGLTLYSSSQDSYGNDLFYFPMATLVNEHEGVYLGNGATQSGAWNALHSEVRRFLAYSPQTLFAWSSTMYSPMFSVYGVLPSDANWTSLAHQMASGSNLVYCDGSFLTYAPLK